MRTRVSGCCIEFRKAATPPNIINHMSSHMNADHLQPEHLENRYREARDLVEHTRFYIVWLLASGKPSENDELLARKLTVAPPRALIGVFGSPRILQRTS